ncbi:MAG: hypothetical protein VX475_08095 [Myxococcota bacterium]|nr:hypothetical protein [Myxococcota bacterium]
MRSKTQIIHEFLERLREGIDTHEELFAELGVIRDQVFTGAVLDDIIPHYTMLADGALEHVPVHQLGNLSLFLGMGIESGLPPECLATPLIARARELFDPLADALGAQVGDEEPEHPLEILARAEPPMDDWWDAVPGVSTALTSVALLSHTAREEMRADNTLMDALEVLANFDASPGWTYDMANMLSHEEILLLHVPSRRGWRARAVGVYNNFQLYTLVLGALQEREDSNDLVDEEISPERLRSYRRFGAGEAGSVSSNLGFYTCAALDDTLQIADPLHHMIYNEGKPWQVPRHGGCFVVLLADAPYHRSLDAQADTDLIDSSITIQATLDEADVERILGDLRKSVVSSLH